MPGSSPGMTGSVRVNSSRRSAAVGPGRAPRRSARAARGWRRWRRALRIAACASPAAADRGERGLGRAGPAECFSGFERGVTAHRPRRAAREELHACSISRHRPVAQRAGKFLAMRPAGPMVDGARRLRRGSFTRGSLALRRRSAPPGELAARGIRVAPLHAARPAPPAPRASHVYRGIARGRHGGSVKPRLLFVVKARRRTSPAGLDHIERFELCTRRCPAPPPSRSVPPAPPECLAGNRSEPLRRLWPHAQRRSGCCASSGRRSARSCQTASSRTRPLRGSSRTRPSMVAPNGTCCGQCARAGRGHAKSRRLLARAGVPAIVVTGPLAAIATAAPVVAAAPEVAARLAALLTALLRAPPLVEIAHADTIGAAAIVAVLPAVASQIRIAALLRAARSQI